MGYRYHAGARAPIDAGKLVADTGKVDDYRYYLRVVEWCFYDPHMQVDPCAQVQEDADVVCWIARQTHRGSLSRGIPKACFPMTSSAS